MSLLQEAILMKFEIKSGSDFELKIENESEIDSKLRIKRWNIKIEIEQSKNTFLKDIDFKKLIFFWVLFAGIYGAATDDYAMFNGLLKAFNNTIDISTKTSRNEDSS
jgi:hypothetical protein